MDFEELLYFVFMDEQEKTVVQNENPTPWENRPQQSGNGA